MGATLNFLIQYEEDANDLLEQIITSNENWIHFYKPERKSVNIGTGHSLAHCNHQALITDEKGTLED